MTTEETKILTTFLPVFKGRIQQNIDSLKEHISKPKKDRDKKALKRILSETKELKHLVKEMEEKESTVVCPSCGEKIKT